MSKKNNRIPPALKHGGYSGTALLPGEDPLAFKKLHDDLIFDFAPNGPVEDDIVASVARLIWRKQNLSTYRLADEAQARFSAIQSELVPQSGYSFDVLDTPDPDEVRAANQAVEKQAREELGPALELVELGGVVTTDHLLQELSVMDRLDGMIDRCLKRLLFVRGLKSISSSQSIAPPRERLSAA